MTSIVWYLSICEDCKPRHPSAFTERDKRCQWAATHADATGHRVIEREATGPDWLRWESEEAS